MTKHNLGVNFEIQICNFAGFAKVSWEVCHTANSYTVPQYADD